MRALKATRISISGTQQLFSFCWLSFALKHSCKRLHYSLCFLAGMFRSYWLNLFFFFCGCETAVKNSGCEKTDPYHLFSLGDPETTEETVVYEFRSLCSMKSIFYSSSFLKIRNYLMLSMKKKRSLTYKSQDREVSCK